MSAADVGDVHLTGREREVLTLLATGPPAGRDRTAARDRVRDGAHARPQGDRAARSREPHPRRRDRDPAGPDLTRARAALRRSLATDRDRRAPREPPAPAPADDRRLPGLPGVERVEPARRPAAGREGLRDADRLDRARLVRSTPTSARGSTTGSGSASPTSSSRGSRTPKTKPRFDYADESDPGPYPIPANVPIEGDPNPGDGDRHALIVDRDTCTLYELYALHRSGTGWAAGSGAIWSLRSNKLRPATLDLGRRGRPADPPRPRPLRRGRGRRRSTTRSASRRPRPAAPTSTRRATTRAARPTRRCRRWACASG